MTQKFTFLIHKFARRFTNSFLWFIIFHFRLANSYVGFVDLHILCSNLDFYSQIHSIVSHFTFLIHKFALKIYMLIFPIHAIIHKLAFLILSSNSQIYVFDSQIHASDSFYRHGSESSNSNFNIIESEFSPTPSEREAALRNRKEQLFLNAKRKFLEKNEKRLVNWIRHSCSLVKFCGVLTFSFFFFLIYRKFLFCVFTS